MKKLDDRGYEKITWDEVFRDIKETGWYGNMKLLAWIAIVVLIIMAVFYFTTTPAQAQTSEYVDIFYRAGTSKAVFRIQSNDGKDDIMKDESGGNVETFLVAQEILNKQGYEFQFTYQIQPTVITRQFSPDTHFVFRKVKF